MRQHDWVLCVCCFFVSKKKMNLASAPFWMFCTLQPFEAAASTFFCVTKAGKTCKEHEKGEPTRCWSISKVINVKSHKVIIPENNREIDIWLILIPYVILFSHHPARIQNGIFHHQDGVLKTPALGTILSQPRKADGQVVKAFSFWRFECSRVSITAPPIRHQKVLGRRRYSDWTMFRGSFQADLLLQFQDFVTRVLLSSSSEAIWCISMQGSFPWARMRRPSFATPHSVTGAWGLAWRGTQSCSWRGLAMVVDGRRTQMSFCCSTV